MEQFNFTETDISGVYIIRPFCASDSRGAFYKYFNTEAYAAHGINFTPKEELLSVSQKNTLRGIHFQLQHSQDKLVHVVSGTIMDVVVDLRPGCVTFGKWLSFELSAKNQEVLYLPKFFGHAFLALEDGTAVHYLCGDVYNAASEGSIRWNDEQLSIDWPLAPGVTPILSARDAVAMSFAEFKNLIKSGAAG